MVLSRYEEQWLNRPPAVVHQASIPKEHLLYWEPVELTVFDDQGRHAGKMIGSRVWLCNPAMPKPSPINVLETTDKIDELFAEAS
jgi:hypothetical protein